MIRFPDITFLYLSKKKKKKKKQSADKEEEEKGGGEGGRGSEMGLGDRNGSAWNTLGHKSPIGHCYLCVCFHYLACLALLQ